MGQLTWEQRKQIGEALGYRTFPSIHEDGRTYPVKEINDSTRAWVGLTEQEAWNAYQPDVLGEVIPWLATKVVSWNGGMHQMGTYGASAVLGPQTMVTVGRDVGYETHGEAVCALMLAVLESGRRAHHRRFARGESHDQQALLRPGRTAGSAHHSEGIGRAEMTEQEAIARLREKLTEADEWDESMAIVESADLRALLDREKRLTEALEEAIQELEDERGHYYMGRPTGASAFIDAVVAPLREALEGKQ